MDLGDTITLMDLTTKEIGNMVKSKVKVFFITQILKQVSHKSLKDFLKTMKW